MHTKSARPNSRRSLLEKLNEALRRFADEVEKVKMAGQVLLVATALSAKRTSELAGLLGLPKSLEPMKPRTFDMFRLAIADLLTKFPNKCPDLERGYRTKLMRWGGGAYGSSNMPDVWKNFVDAGIALVKCLLKGGGGPPGTALPG